MGSGTFERLAGPTFRWIHLRTVGHARRIGRSTDVTVWNESVWTCMEVWLCENDQLFVKLLVVWLLPQNFVCPDTQWLLSVASKWVDGHGGAHVDSSRRSGSQFRRTAATTTVPRSVAVLGELAPRRTLRGWS